MIGRYENLDDAKFDYATGWAAIRDVVDRVSSIKQRGDAIGADERDLIHDRLRETFRCLENLYVRGFIDPCWLDADCDEGDDDGCYGDGSPVWKTIEPAEDFPQGATYCGDLGPADNLMPGIRIVVERPTHLRDNLGRM